MIGERLVSSVYSRITAGILFGMMIGATPDGRRAGNLKMKAEYHPIRDGVISEK